MQSPRPSPTILNSEFSYQYFLPNALWDSEFWILLSSPQIQGKALPNSGFWILLVFFKRKPSIWILDSEFCSVDPKSHGSTSEFWILDFAQILKALPPVLASDSDFGFCFYQ